MFLQQLDYWNAADRMFFLFAYMLPLTIIIFGFALFVEYKLEKRKRKNRKRR